MPGFLIAGLLALTSMWVPWTATVTNDPPQIVITQQVAEAQELVQPPVIATTTAESVACNCYLYVFENVKGFPAHQKDVVSNSPPKIGGVVLFDYAGTPHYAKIIAVYGDHFTVTESNLHKCTFDTRDVSWKDPFIIGYFYP